MKKLIFSSIMLISLSSLAATTISRIQLASAGWHLPTVVELGTGEKVQTLEWKEDSVEYDELNVYFESNPNNCYIVKLDQVEINDKSTLIASEVTRDSSCDK